MPASPSASHPTRAGTLRRRAALYRRRAAAYNPPGDAGLADSRPALGRRLFDGRRRLRWLDDLDASAVHRRRSIPTRCKSARTVGPGAAHSGQRQPVGQSPSGSRRSTCMVTATSSGGTAFFDPGAGYLCRIGASIPGVTVNSVTRTSPTTATVNISTVGAAAGSRRSRIVNPDAQSATSGAILRVLARAARDARIAGGGRRGATPRGTEAGRSMATRRAAPAWTPCTSGPIPRRATRCFSARRPTACPARTWERFTVRSSPPSGFSLRAAVGAAGRRRGRSLFTRTARSAARSTRRPRSPSRCAARRALWSDRHASERRHRRRRSSGDRLGARRCGRRARGRVPLACCRREPGLIFVGRAVFIRGARPDVQALYPSTPSTTTTPAGASWCSRTCCRTRATARSTSMSIATDYAGLPTQPRHAAHRCRQRRVGQALRHHRHARAGGDRLWYDRQLRLGADAAAEDHSDRRQHHRRVHRRCLQRSSGLQQRRVGHRRRSSRASATPATGAGRSGSSCSIRRRSRTACIPSTGSSRDGAGQSVRRWEPVLPRSELVS